MPAYTQPLSTLWFWSKLASNSKSGDFYKTSSSTKHLVSIGKLWQSCLCSLVCTILNASSCYFLNFTKRNFLVKYFFFFTQNTLLTLEIFKFFKFLSNLFRVTEEVGNGINMKSWNGLHKLLIINFRVTQKSL